jgi:uncharacterized protein YggT (Ycf19 family)
MPLADAVDTAQRFVDTIFLVYLICIFAYIISSWLPLPYNIWLNRIQRFLYDIVNPYLSIFRRLLPQLSRGGFGLDFTPILAILFLFALERIIQALIDQAR